MMTNKANAMFILICAAAMLLIHRVISLYTAEAEEQRIGERILEERKKMFGKTEDVCVSFGYKK